MKRTSLPIPAMIFGAYLGYGFPDLDQSTSFLLHRSIITHSILFLIFLIVIQEILDSNVIRGFTAGFGIALAGHLSYDLYPKNFNFYGHACIHVPFIGSIGGILSFIWILGNMTFGVICAQWSISRIKDSLMKIIMIMSIPVMGVLSAYYEYGKYSLFGISNRIWGFMTFVLVAGSIIFVGIVYDTSSKID